MKLHHLTILTTEGSLWIRKEMRSPLKLPFGGHIAIMVRLPFVLPESLARLVKAVWLCSSDIVESSN